MIKLDFSVGHCVKSPRGIGIVDEIHITKDCEKPKYVITLNVVTDSYVDWCYGNELTLVDDNGIKIKPELKFDIGDVVSTPFGVGTIIKISILTKVDTLPYRVEFDDGLWRWSSEEDMKILNQQVF